VNSKERVRASIMHKQPDRVPADFACVEAVMEKLIKHYGFTNSDQVYDKFNIDIRYVDAPYIGPELKHSYENGDLVVESYYGYKSRRHWTGIDYNFITCYYPFDEFTTIEEIENYNWPRTEWFDYEAVKRQCEKYKDKAIIIGSAGVYQFATFMREASKLYMDMALEPDFAKRIFDRFVEFELEHYEKILQAADGQVDILRCYDDYGTQTGMLFGMDMWRYFFKENTSKLADLAHKYGAFYMQHSCGAVRPIIPELIDCGVDMLDPVQRVVGMEPEKLKKDFGDKITFHGGIDTQWILPYGSPEEVLKESKYYIDTLGKDGGYILYPSQEFQADIPIENIEALYNARFI
jgi:uroporphyrinogen decarboxylase